MEKWTVEELRDGKGEFSVLGATQLKTLENNRDTYIFARLGSGAERVYAIVSTADTLPIMLSENEMLKLINNDKLAIDFVFRTYCNRYCIEDEEME